MTGGFLEKNWFKLAVALILLAMIASFGYKLWFADGAASQDDHLKPGKQAPDFQLLNWDEKQVASKDMDGKVRLVYFFYSNCPDVCLPTSFTLSKVQDELKAKGLLGSKADILSITIDPKRDTPAVLKEFGSRFHADTNAWKFLSAGDEKQATDLAEKFGVMVVRDKDGNLSHSNPIIIIDPKGVIRSYYDPSDPMIDANYIVKDVIALSKGK
jgi:protein SCO1/2